MTDQSSYRTTAEKLLSVLRNRHRRLRLEGRISALFLFTAVFLAGFSLFLFAEQSQFLSAGVKTATWAAIFVFAGLTSCWVVRHVSDDEADFTRFYRAFCETHGFSELENALDLYLDPASEKSGLHLLAIEKNLQQIDQPQFRRQLRAFTSERRPHRTFITASTLTLAALLVAGSAAWMDTGSAHRTLSFWEEFEKPNPHNFTLAPGDTTLEHGSSFEPGIEFHGRTPLPGSVNLAVKTDIEDEYRYRPLEQTGERTFHSRPLELTNDATWYIRMDDHVSEIRHVDVQFRPRFEALSVVVEPPSYTGLPTSQQEYPFARLSAYGGSEITVKGTVNKPLDDMALLFGSEELQMDPSGEDPLSLGTSFTLSQRDTVRFAMSDEDGLANQNPFRFIVDLLEDEYPVVVIHEPGSDLSLPDPDRIDIFYQAADDFGLSRAELNWELHRAFTSDPATGSRRLDRPQVGETQHIDWNLEDLELRPRDRLTFWITVWDNDGFNGYKSATSQQITLEIPSMSAWQQEIDRRERDVQDALDEVSQSYREMEQEYERFRERLRQNTEPGWEEEQILDDIHQRKDEMDESIRELSEQFEEIRQEMESNNRISDETQRAYNELQDLMEQLDDPELQKALEELRKSLQELNPQQLQRTMEDFEFNEQLYRERLERTLELFKTLKMNSDLDRLAAQYEDLSERMENISRQEMGREEQYHEQQGVREDTEMLEDQLDGLDNRPPRRAEERLRQLKQESTAELQEIRQKIDELIEESRGEPGSEEADGAMDTEEAGDPGGGDETGGAEEAGDAGDASGDSEGAGDAGGDSEEAGDAGARDETSRRQQEIAEQFQRRADALRDAQQEMSGQQIQVNLLALQQSLYTLLELSESQEELTQQSGQTESQSQGFVELARKQQNISEQFSLVADTLFQISAELPNLSDAINKKRLVTERTLSRAVDQMAERQQRTSIITARESLGGLNELASMLAEVIDQLMDQQGGAGQGSMTMQQLIEQMQQMSGDQQMMNQMLEELINDVQGERLTQQQSERLEQLARQQNEIRRQLEKLQRSGALRQGDRELSDLQRMAEQMEDAINDMRGGMIDPLMVERQQNILSRMLDAEESLQERGQSEDEFEGRRPEDYERTMPPDITLEELEQEIRQRLQDPSYTRFRDDYQRLIERYFELLRRFEERPLP